MGLRTIARLVPTQNNTAHETENKIRTTIH
jgi:hypothetical protein